MKWATQGCPLVVSCPQRQKHETYQGKCVCPCVPPPGQRWWKDDYRFGTRMSFGSLVRKSALLPADMRGCHLHQYSWFAYFLLTTSRFSAQPCAIAEAGVKSLRFTLVHPTAKLSSSNWPMWQTWFQPAPAKNVFFPSKRLYCVVQSQFRKLQPCLASCPDLCQIQILEGKSYFASIGFSAYIGVLYANLALHRATFFACPGLARSQSVHASPSQQCITWATF